MGGEVDMATLQQRLIDLSFEKDMDFNMQAGFSGVPVFTMRNMLLRYGNTTQPRADTLTAIARFYDVSVDYLLGVSDVRRRFGE